LRQQYGLKQNDILVGSLGNIRSSKGYQVLLQAASILNAGSHSFHFIIAGHSHPGGLYDGLLKLREELGLTHRVHFLGFTEDPADFLSNLDIFLLSSTSEGFSIATIQAMAAGLPVVATRSGGPQEIVENGKNGLLVDVNNAGAIADALVSLVNDKALCAHLSKNAREHVVEKFGIDVMLHAYKELYSDFIDDGTSSCGK
jgi:glycosyltransferase involved in cell wall biosynthesis